MSPWTRTRMPDVTEEQVAAALDALAREGHACPSIRKVQERVGGGSFTTISAKLSAIRTRRQRSEAALDSFPALFEALLRDTQAAIERTADNRLAERREQIEAELHLNHERMQEIENELIELLRHSQAQAQRIEELQRLNAQLLGNLEGPYKELADTRVRCAQLEAENRQLSERLGEVMQRAAAHKDTRHGVADAVGKPEEKSARS